MKSHSSYHSPLRQAQAAATHTQILKACVEVMQSGADLTYTNVATAAGVQERTVYRHFPTKADLEAGLWGWIIANVSHANFDAKSEDELVASMRSSFAGFDTAAPLIQAMLHSNQGLAIRRHQQATRRAMFEACAEAAVPGVPPQTRTRVAAALQVLYSAPAWELLRSFWGMDASEAADVVELAMRALLAGLRADAAQGQQERSPPGLRRGDRNGNGQVRVRREGMREDGRGGSHDRDDDDHA
jgi:AcrR family transcriptional regulator